jgi:dUTP pyrophosphatase
MNNVTVAYTGDCVEPKYASEFAAGCDLCASEELTIYPGERKLVPTGLFVAIPAGLEGQIRPRSGIALKHGVTVLNSPGTVDSDYRGEIKILLVNLGNDPFKIAKGDRVAQFIFAPVMHAKFVKMPALPVTERGTEGFGSTGK